MAGRVTTQGDRVMKSDRARELFNLDGSGITIGVISDSYNSQRGSVIDMLNGELPSKKNRKYRSPVEVIADSPFGSDEGRAMLQIIHDVAPGARLLFHSAGDSEASFAQAIRTLAAKGADIIVDDVFFPTELLLQDGLSARAVSDVADKGVLYFSAAGNDFNYSYESPFNAEPSLPFSFQGRTYWAHDFELSETQTDLFQQVQMPANTFLNLLLNWDEPAGTSQSDLEIFLLDRPVLPGQGSTILAAGTVIPDAEADPSSELAYYTSQTQTAYLLIARRTDEPMPNFIKWNSIAGTSAAGMRVEYVNDGNATRAGSTVFGHPNALQAIAVGAANYQSIRQLRPFTSRGFSPILFDANGNRLSVPQIRRKPDIAAPDGVSTSVAGFESFTGTSAAVPHLAAVAALILQRVGKQGMNYSQLLAILQQTALLGTGEGINQPKFVQALAAVWYSGLPQTDMAQHNRLVGTSGADNLDGQGGNDVLVGKSGIDALLGGKGSDLLMGGTGNDFLSGQGESDLLVGGAGDDLLMGGMGKNVLKGGKGADRFALETDGFSLISDFHSGIDQIGLIGMRLNHLRASQDGHDTILYFQSRPIARVANINPNNLLTTAFYSSTLTRTDIPFSFTGNSYS